MVLLFLSGCNGSTSSREVTSDEAVSDASLVCMTHPPAELRMRLFKQEGETCLVASSVTALIHLDAFSGGTEHLRRFIEKYKSRVDDTAALSRIQEKLCLEGLGSFTREDFLKIVGEVYMNMYTSEVEELPDGKINN